MLPWLADFGVTSSGFVSKDLPTIESEVDAGLKAILGESAGTESDGSIPAASYAGQLKALIVDAVAAQWDLQQAVYSARDPNQATAASQDAVCALTGTLREAEEQSTATVICSGVLNTQLPAGRVLTVTSTGVRFDGAAATLAAATAWAALTVYAVGDIRTNNGNVYYCITAGTAAASGGPTTTASDITDGTVHWLYLSAGTAYASVAFLAESAGPFGALAGTLVNIATPVTGWNAAYNPADAVVGRFVETDAALRARRDAELAAAGNTTRDTILANILKVNEGSGDPNHEPPTSVKVFANDTDYTDANGVPPHSIEVLALGGTDADIAQAIWDSVGAGTYTYGQTSANITDSQGNTQTVRYTRPTEVPIYVTATVYYDPAEWTTASAPDTLVAQAMLSALLTYTQDFPIGVDVRTAPLLAAFLRGPQETGTDGLAVVPATEGSNAAPGILEATIFIGIAPSPGSSATVSIGSRQVATFDSSRCVITATSETP